MTTQATPDAPQTTDKPKRTRRPNKNKAPTEIALYAIGKSPDGTETLTRLPMPTGLDISDPKNRNQVAIKRAIKEATEKNGAQHYAGKRLRVVFMGSAFTCAAKIEEIKVVKVTMTDD